MRLAGPERVPKKDLASGTRGGYPSSKPIETSEAIFTASPRAGGPSMRDATDIAGLQPLGSGGRALVLVFAIVLALLFGSIELAIGPEISFSIFYLLPIAAVSWFVGGRAGTIVAGACGIISVTADAYGGATYSQLWIPFWNGAALLGFFLLAAAALSHLRRVLGREARLAREDLLTRVPNLRSFNEQMPLELRAAAGRGSSVTLGLVELDDLAYINERFGIKSGDLLLRVTADTLRASLRAEDLICRIGGTTFALILPGTGKEEASRILEDAREKVLHQMRIYDRPLSIAIAAVSTDHPSPQGEDLMERTGWLLQTIKRDRSLHPFRVIGTDQIQA